MRYLYLKAKNFIGFYNGLGLKDLEFDFSQHHNRFIILLGGNGSGKTTLLSILNPFSGVIDEDRDMIIRPDKKGYKEVHIAYENKVYIIKHHYTPKTSGHSVKSYITLMTSMGEVNELNPNGNVGEFLQIVETELDISKETLHLMRFGSRVSSLIDKKASERKNYINKFTEGVNIYLRMSKNISEKFRNCNALLSSIASNINKLGNKLELESELEHIERLIQESDVSKSNLIKLASIHESKLHEIDLENCKDDLKDSSSEITRISNRLKRVNEALLRYTETEISNMPTLIKEYEGRLNKLETEKEKNITLFNYVKEELVDNLNKLNELNIEVAKYEIPESYNNLLEYIKTCEKQKSGLESVIKGRKFKITLEEAKSCYDTLDIFQMKLRNMVDLELPEKLILDTSHLNNNINFHRNRIMEIQREKEKLRDEIMNYGGASFISLSSRPSECKIDTCPYVLDAMEKESSVKKIRESEQKLRSYDAELNYINESMLQLSNNKAILNEIEVIASMINNIKHKLVNIPDGDAYTRIITYVNMIDNKRTTIYDSLKKTEFLDILGLVEDYEKVCESIAKSKNEMLRFNESLSMNNMLNIQIDNVAKHIDTLNVKSKSLSANIAELEGNINDVKQNIELLSRLVVDIDMRHNLQNELNDLVKLSKRLETDIQTYTESAKQLSLTNKEINMLNDKLNDSISQRDKILYKLNHMKKLLKEKKKVDMLYNDLVVMKEALSSSKGVPLVFVEYYLQSTRKLANKLLTQAFDGRLQLGKFIINDKEFRIPCEGKGEENKDASTNSDGERAIITLSLSFALAIQSSAKYNVMQIDEMDGPLDAKHRKLFVNILEKQADILNIEQMFIISHNEALKYHDDAAFILLKDHGLTGYDKSKVIYEY